MKNRRKKRLNIRLAVTGILLGLQLAVILAAVIKFAKLYPLYRGLSLLLGIGLLLHLIRRSTGMGYKLAWTVLILLFPLFGASVYLMFSGSCLSGEARRRMERARDSHKILMCGRECSCHCENSYSKHEKPDGISAMFPRWMPVLFRR